MSMMSAVKKIAGLVLCLVLVASGTLACVKTGGTTSSGSISTTATAATTTNTTTANTTATATTTVASQPAGGQGILNLADTGPITLDPATAAEASSAQYIVQIFSGLVRLDQNMDVVPDIAQSWDKSTDGKTTPSICGRT